MASQESRVGSSGARELGLLDPEVFLMFAPNHLAPVNSQAAAFEHLTDIVWCPAVVLRGVEGFAQLENRTAKS